MSINYVAKISYFLRVLTQKNLNEMENNVEYNCIN